jgi:Fur family peroxide stress response transcriptional regulator
MDQQTRKHSKKRDAILELLRSVNTHPTAQWVYEQLKPRIPGLSLGTVYRNLTYFRQTGLAASVGIVNGEERFDGFTAPHPHLVCSRCGAVVDFPGPGEAELTRLTAKAVNSGCRVDYKKTIFSGLCPHCAGRQIETTAVRR